MFSIKHQIESQIHPADRVDNGRFMKPTTTLAAAVLLFFPMHSPAAAAGPYQYPFQNPDLPIEQRVDNIVSLMTLDEKVACLGTRPIPHRAAKSRQPRIRTDRWITSPASAAPAEMSLA